MFELSVSFHCNSLFSVLLLLRINVADDVAYEFRNQCILSYEFRGDETRQLLDRLLDGVPINCNAMSIGYPSVRLNAGFGLHSIIQSILVSYISKTFYNQHANNIDTM